MGNAQSQSGSPGTDASKQGKKSLSRVINFIATNYILTQSFEDMEALKDSKYCDKLIMVTSDVLNKYLSKMDVQYLAQKMKKGVEVNEMTEENVLYLRKDDLYKMDVKNAVTKKHMCIGLAKYYVKVAHIFSAIVTTINPTYIYKDEFGNRITVPFNEKSNIPKGVDVKINKVNLCSQRIDALVNGQDLSMKDPTQPIKIKPNFCQMNIDKKETEEMEKRVVKTLSDEPGISQLERLYNDVYDYQAGKFTGMSDQMREEYNKDLTILYKSFTGKDEMPESIHSFSQIPLRDFRSMNGCNAEPNNQYMLEYEGTAKQKLFVQYANHIKETMDTASKNKDALIAILDKLFVFAVNPQTKKPEITINPKLTDPNLSAIVNETQKLIINLYVTCESNFIKGLEIFEQIINEQIKQQTQKKIDGLKTDMLSVSMPGMSNPATATATATAAGKSN